MTINELRNNSLRSHFPILTQKIHNSPLIYFDNAATTQKPLSVINAVSEYYSTLNASYNRSSHTLAFQTARQIEQTKQKILTFLDLPTTDYDVFFTKNTTEGLNTLAQGFFTQRALTQTEQMRMQRIILISEAEHHSNILPWMQASQQYGYNLERILLTKTGDLDLEWLDAYVATNKDNIEILSVTHASNVTGLVTDIAKIKAILYKYGTNFPLIIDGAQSIAHTDISLKQVLPDAFVFSGHKMYGPAGIGAVAIKKSLVPCIEPLQIGGGMVQKVTSEYFSPYDSVDKFHAGTLNHEGIIGLSAAIDFITSVGRQNIIEHEKELTTYFSRKLKLLPHTSIGVEEQSNKIGIFSFSIPEWHPHDLADELDKCGIAVRSGYHCAEPLHQLYSVPGTTRVSFGIYNTTEEIDVFFEKLGRIISK